MKDTARNTAQHQTIFGRDVNLRARPVTFISAGQIEPMKELGSQVSSEHSETIKMRAPADGDDGDDGDDGEVEHTEDISLLPQEHGEPNNTAEVRVTHENFGCPLAGTSVVNSLVPPVVAPNQALDDAPEGGDSESSDVILFRGRTKPARCRQPQATATRAERDTQVIPDMGSSGQQISPTRDLQSPLAVRAEVSDDDDATIADYIAHLAGGSDDDFPCFSTFGSRDLGGDDVILGDGADHLDDTSYKAGSGGEKEDCDASGTEDDRESPGLDSNMDDGTLARLLSEQEGFGMGSRENAIIGAHTAPRTAAECILESSRRPALLDGRFRSPTASAVADAFDDLDLMDWNRPSLQNFNKGRRKKPIFNVGDPDLEMAMWSSWEKDREKKKRRKLEREELRAQGLLGKRANPDDLRVKYTSGMSLEDIKEEMREFLLSSEET